MWAIKSHLHLARLKGNQEKFALGTAMFLELSDSELSTIKKMMVLWFQVWNTPLTTSREGGPRMKDRAQIAN